MENALALDLNVGQSVRSCSCLVVTVQRQKEEKKRRGKKEKEEQKKKERKKRRKGSRVRDSRQLEARTRFIWPVPVAFDRGRPLID